MSGKTYPAGEATLVQRRRRWSADAWRRLYAEGTAGAGVADEVPIADYRALQNQVHELQRLLGKKTLENEMLRQALDQAQSRRRLVPPRSVDRSAN